HFPADFICEAIDQTRGWFYTLHAIGTLVSDSVAFRNCVCLSHLVDRDGKKMSKSLGNIVDPYAVFDTTGADALRWYFAARVAPEAQKRVSVDIIADVAGTFLNTYWNTYAFFCVYANLDGVQPEVLPGLEKLRAQGSLTEMDRWALALLEQTIATATACLDGYDAQGAGEAIESFVEQLSNWYVRLNRRRFWKAEAGPDKQAAYRTLYHCLTAVNRLMAPFMPFVTEAVHQNLARSHDPAAPESVHLENWPEPTPALMDAALVARMAVVQKVVSLGRAARAQAKLKVRQPLAKVLVRVPDAAAREAVASHTPQALEELNVKALEFIAADATLVSYRVRPNLPRIGKRYGRLIPAIRAALEQADGRRIAVSCHQGVPTELRVEGQTLVLDPEDLLIETHSAEGYVSAEDGGYLVALDTRLTPALLREGLAREIVRCVQDARKQAGLAVSDRIRLYVGGAVAVQQALLAHQDTVLGETLATGFYPAQGPQDFAVEHEVDGHLLRIALRKA
ncbi:MAG TPA: DUF5915 domain-containing protein, partial [bacterium]|nr:DUF5915 domain-containing protein [bacterium]